MTEPWASFGSEFDPDVEGNQEKYLPIFISGNDRTRYIIAMNIGNSNSGTGFGRLLLSNPSVHIDVEPATGDYIYANIWEENGKNSPELPGDWRKDYPEKTFVLDENFDKLDPLLSYPLPRLKKVIFKNDSNFYPSWGDQERLGKKLAIPLQQGYHPNLDHLLNVFESGFPWSSGIGSHVSKGLYEEAYVHADECTEDGIEWLAWNDPLTTLILSPRFLSKLPGLYDFLDRYINDDEFEPLKSLLRPLLTNTGRLSPGIYKDRSYRDKTLFYQHGPLISGWRRDLIERWRSDLS